jgi:hypothetical protein
MRWVVSPDHSHDEFVSGVTFGGTLESTSRHPISSGDPDPHVPWSRVEASARELERMGLESNLCATPEDRAQLWKKSWRSRAH